MWALLESLEAQRAVAPAPAPTYSGVQTVSSAPRTISPIVPLATVQVPTLSPVTVQAPSVAKVLANAAILDVASSDSRALGTPTGFVAPKGISPAPAGLSTFAPVSSGPSLQQPGGGVGITSDAITREGKLADAANAVTSFNVKKGGDWLVIAAIAFAAWVVVKHPGSLRFWK